MSTITEQGVAYSEIGQPVYKVSQIQDSPLFKEVELMRLNMFYSNTQKEEAEYELYLKLALNKADILSRRVSGTHIEVSAKTLKDELRFWKTRNFLWPSILPNFKGGVVLVWKVGDDNIRFERVGEREYSVFVFSSMVAVNPKVKVQRNRKKLLREDLPTIYGSMVRKAKDKRDKGKEILLKSVQSPLPPIAS